MRLTGEGLAALVADGLSVDVVGRPLSGRSTILDVAADRLRERDVDVVRIAGIRAWRDRPLAVLTTADLGGSVAPTSVADLVRTLVARTGPRPSALVVDDLDDLDPASAGVLHAAHRETRAPLVTARRTGSDEQAVVRELLGAVHGGVGVEVGPLPFDEMHQLVHDVLGGAVDPAAVAGIAVLAGRLPGLAAALVAAARTEGVLVESSGLWESIGAISARGLARALAPLTRALDPAEHDGLTVLALAGRPTVPAAERLVGPDLLLRLERLGLVTTTDESGTDAVAVVPPALGELMVRTCGPLHRAQVERQIADQFARRLAPLGSGHGPSLEDSVTTKRIADHWEAERQLLLRAWQDDPRPGTATALLTATLVCAEPDPSPEEIREGTDLGSGDAPDAARFECWYAVHLAVHRRSLDEARVHLDGCARRYPESAGTVAVVRAHLEAVFDRVPDPSAVDALVASSSGAALATAEVVRLESAVYAGRSSTALRLLRGRSTRGALNRSTAEAAHGMALILDGRVAEGTDRALDGVAAARAGLDPGMMQAHAYVAATGLTLAGRFREVDTLVALSLTMTTRTPQEEHFRGGVLSLAAIAALWQSRWAYARRLAFQSRALDYRSGPLPAMVPGPLLAISSTPGLATASEEIWDAAVERLDRGYVAAAALAALTSIERDPDPVRGARLREALHGVESPLLQTFGDYAAATAERDVAGLGLAQEALSAMGVHTYATRAVVSSARVLRDRGDTARALETIGRAWELTDRLDSEQVAFFHPYVRALDLSSRELEIVDMITTGLTAGEVASALGISPRTVESHLLAAYKKIGMDNREDLRLAVTTWLGAPSR